MNPQKWIKNYGDYLYSMAYLKTGQRETAEDLVQETFLSAYKAAGSFEGKSSEKTWLTTILNHKIIDHYRKKDILRDAGAYLSETEEDFNKHFFETGGSKPGHWLAASAPKEWAAPAEEGSEREEFYRILQFCLSKLPPRLVPAFTARFLEDADSENICKDLNITPSNYWVLIHRAKVLMRSCLEKNWLSH